MAIYWIKFLFCSLIILVAGYKLSRYGQVICQKTFLSEGWMGVAFLAIATSLPEMITGVGSVTSVDCPNLAMGDVMGSIIFNLMIIAVLDIQQGKGAILFEAKREHILTGGLTVILLGILALSMMTRSMLGSQWNLLGIGVDSIMLIFMYVVGMNLVYRYSRRELFDDKEGSIGKNNSPPLSPISNIKEALWQTWLKFILCALFILGSGVWLARIGNSIVKMGGWSEEYFGTIFLALATSLPELVVACSALKIGSVDMAIGNILGSNFFDIAIIPVVDIAYRKGGLLSFVSSVHIFTAMLAIVLTSIAILGLIYRSKKSILKLGWDVAAMVVVFIVGNYFLFLITR